MCLKYKKASLKPVIGVARFNDVIPMELKEINRFKILHLIDHANSLLCCENCIIETEKDIVKAIFKIWITLFGPLKEILSDNGSESNNDLLRDLLDQLNIFIRTTPVKSPWSNRITDRQNAISTNMIYKLLIDKSNNYSVDTIVAWAVSTKNIFIIIMDSVQINYCSAKNPIFRQFSLINRRR